MITFKHSGNFKNAERFMSTSRSEAFRSILNRYGRLGIDALVKATPVDTGITADSWDFWIAHHAGSYIITWTNSHVVNGAPIAILIQYGHATGSGGYVQGRDYINPTMKPIFEKIAKELYEEVIKI